MSHEITDKEDRLLSTFFTALRIFGYVVAFAPLVLSVWVFHYNRELIQNGLVNNGDSGSEMAQPLINQWEIYRNGGYIFYLVLILIIALFILIYLYNRNRHLKAVIRIITPDTVIGILLLTFSFTIGAFLTDIYLLLLNAVGL